MAVTDFLKKAFPFISAAASLGGPLGTLAANAVGKALGVDKVTSTPEGIAAAIAGATPEQIAALQQAEHDFEIKMQQLGFQHAEELESIAEKDRESARNREVAVKDKTPSILGFAITIGFFTTLWYVFVHGVDASTKDLAYTMVGTLGTAWIGVVTYYFGSSAGSDRKTELLAQQKPQS